VDIYSVGLNGAESLRTKDYDNEYLFLVASNKQQITVIIQKQRNCHFLLIEG